MRLRSIRQQAPVTITLELPESVAYTGADQLANVPPPAEDKFVDVKYDLPRFPGEEWERWADEIDAGREERAVGRLAVTDQAKFLLLWPIVPILRREMADRVNTPGGSRRVFRICAKLGNVPDGVVEWYLKNCDESDLESVVARLMNFVTDEQIAAAEARRKAEEEAARKGQQQQHNETDAEREARQNPLSGSSGGSTT